MLEGPIYEVLFLATGTVRDPEKGRYQLEIFSVIRTTQKNLASLMKKFMLDAKVLQHKKWICDLSSKSRRYYGFSHCYWCHDL